jgi:hypothetical protein
MFIVNILHSFRQFLFVLFYNVMISFLRVYLYIKDTFKEERKLEFKYASTYYYSDYNVSEYTVNVYDEDYYFCFLEFDDTDESCVNFSDKEIMRLMEKRTYVLYCAICDDNFHLDCTDHLRRFCLYYENENVNRQVTWKRILHHISLIENLNLETSKYKLHLYKDDKDMSEEIHTIDPEFLEQHFIVK